MSRSFIFILRIISYWFDWRWKEELCRSIVGVGLAGPRASSAFVTEEMQSFYSVIFLGGLSYNKAGGALQKFRKEPQEVPRSCFVGVD